MTVYPTYQDVLQVHAELIDRFGGTYGLRDSVAIHSALARPQSGYYSDLLEEAAALGESLSQNHPFVDGNKRVPITIAIVFLEVNGLALSFDDLEAYHFVIGLYESGRFRHAELTLWLRAQLVVR
jgi:death-on-curing protein